jgi:hypothetical protein
MLHKLSESKTSGVVMCGTRMHCYTIRMDALFFVFVKQATTLFTSLIE